MAGNSKKQPGNGLALQEDLPYKIAIVHGHISQVFEDKCLSSADVSLSGWRVLAHVDVENGISASDVVEKSGMQENGGKQSGQKTR